MRLLAHIGLLTPPQLILLLGLSVSSHSGCLRYGFEPPDRNAVADAWASDGVVDTSSHDVVMGDASADSAADSQAGVGDSAAGDGGSGRQLLFVLRTISVDPEVFSPSATKSGDVLRWELGDGTTLDANSVSYTYGQAGEKVVRVLSSDGALGLTSLGLASNALTGSIPSELGQLSNLRFLVLNDNQLTGYETGALSDLTDVQMIWLQDNQLDQTAVDAIIDDIYEERDDYTHIGAKMLNLGGTNAGPSVAARAQADELRASFGWIITCNGC